MSQSLEENVFPKFKRDERASLYLSYVHSFMHSIGKQEAQGGPQNATDRLVLQDWLKENDFWGGPACMYCVARWPHLLAPRLNFADWRQEVGDDDWAEFIRIQVEVYNWPKAGESHLYEVLELEPRAYVLGSRHSVEHPTTQPRRTVNRRQHQLLDSEQLRNEFMVYNHTGDRVCGAYAWACSTSLVCYSTRDLVFRGGFPDQVSTTEEIWRKRGPRVVAHCPVRQLYFTDHSEWPGLPGNDELEAARRLAWTDYSA